MWPELIAERARDIILVIASDGRILDGNPAAERAYGYTRAELVTLNIRDLRGEETVRDVHDQMREADARGILFETIHRKKSGQTFPCEVSSQGATLDGAPVLVSIIRDISERKRAELALHESEERFRLLADATFEGTMVLDGERIIDVNAALSRILARAPEELRGANPLDFVAPEYRELVRERIRTGYDWPYRGAALRPDGTPVAVEISGRTMVLGGRRVRVTVLHDLTERERAEHAIERSEARFRSIIESSTDGILVHRDGKIIFVNPAVLTLLGYGDERELIGQSPLALVHPDDRARVEERLTALAAGAPRVPALEQRMLRRDGGPPLEVEIVGLRIEFDGRPSMMAILRDVAERRRLEEQLRQAQKMEAVGRLAGGVAHDFNNILTAIQGQCELLLQSLDAKSPGHRHGELILRAAGRAASLTGQLLAFSRKQVLQPRVLELNHLVLDSSAMVATLLGETVELQTELDPSLARVKADPNQLEQVIVNLLVNARDAMPDGGRVLVRTANEGGQVLLEVRDTGIGMDAETLARIFEPFFTTKKPRKGTGLGLSTVYGIVAQSGGTITAESAPGQGALFRVLLPAAEGALEPQGAQPTAHAPGGRETVLLVEDDGDVRQFLCEVLEGHGYRVLVARDGIEAVRLAEAQAHGAELLLTDVVMPRMSGPEVAERLRPLWPSLRVLFISGYAEQSLGATGAPLLKKPFTVAELARRVRDVLDAPAT